MNRSNVVLDRQPRNTLCIWGTWHVIAASFKIGQEEGDYSINDPGTTGNAKLRSLSHITTKIKSQMDLIIIKILNYQPKWNNGSK